MLTPDLQNAANIFLEEDQEEKKIMKRVLSAYLQFMELPENVQILMSTDLKFSLKPFPK